jgi:hypothetical protein
MAMRDMRSREEFNHQISAASILVAFPSKYQHIEMENKVWAGCFEEAERRVKEYMEKHLEDWKKRAKVFLSENPDIQV